MFLKGGFPYHYIPLGRFEAQRPNLFWESIKIFINFLNDNFLGIIFFVFIIRFIIISYLNYKISKQYKRENGDNDKKFITKRCKDDGDDKGRNHIYLVNKDDETYQRLEDTFTLNKLGYGSASRRDENCFSKEDYTIKKRIKYYKIFFNAGSIFKLGNDN